MTITNYEHEVRRPMSAWRERASSLEPLASITITITITMTITITITMTITNYEHDVRSLIYEVYMAGTSLESRASSLEYDHDYELRLR